MIYLVGALAAGGLYLYNKAKTKDAGQAGVTSKVVQPAQPSQVSKFVPPPSSRADNANQPWYAGATNFSPQTTIDVQKVMDSTSVTNSSLTSIWAGLAGGTGKSTDDAKSNLFGF